VQRWVVVIPMASRRLLKKLPQYIEPGRHIYIATNEKTPHFFDPLRALYKVHLMEDFSHLWSNTSRW